MSMTMEEMLIRIQILEAENKVLSGVVESITTKMIDRIGDVHKITIEISALREDIRLANAGKEPDMEGEDDGTIRDGVQGESDNGGDSSDTPVRTPNSGP